MNKKLTNAEKFGIEASKEIERLNSALRDGKKEVANLQETIAKQAKEINDMDTRVRQQRAVIQAKNSEIERMQERLKSEENRANVNDETAIECHAKWMQAKAECQRQIVMRLQADENAKKLADDYGNLVYAVNHNSSCLEHDMKEVLWKEATENGHSVDGNTLLVLVQGVFQRLQNIRNVLNSQIPF